jgi:hypothetical protein
MKSVYETCVPRQDIVSGTFNPELFTASLKQVTDRYAGKSVAESPYTDAHLFFGEATYPTSGMKDLMSTALRRLSGDNGASAITRLETGFGGGKTHSLIGLVHSVMRGTEIKDVIDPIFPDLPLPNAGEVNLVAIAGDVVSVNRSTGKVLNPHTLWGEMARQLGGETLYRELKTDVESIAAPGEDFFLRVVDGKKVLILIDELAQYVTRFEAAHPGKGAEQVAAFLMSLSTFARARSGISVVISLASASDAFSRQSDALAEQLSRITGSSVSTDEARSAAVSAIKQTESVVARDALPIVPVPQSELARVLARRLFSDIDDDAAGEMADEYVRLYDDCPSDLPSEAKQSGFRGQIKANYPFHPTFIRFLNEKLASIETFQGTRGVLRVMTLAIRLIWEKRPFAPMIHVGHLDFRNSVMTGEIIGSRLRTDSMQVVLNTDVGGPRTDALETQLSRAQSRDQANPLPTGIPYHEMAWRTVLVNSLVGRSDGTKGNLYGINESDAMLALLMPDLPAPAIKTALEAIPQYAYYLREQDGRYFASTDPTINRVLADIRQGLTAAEANSLVVEAARKVITSANGLFSVCEDVSSPGDIPDSPKKPSIGVIRVDAGRITLNEFIETLGSGRPRVAQNHVALLIPSTVVTDREEAGFLAEQRAEQQLSRLLEIAKDVRAIEKLNANPESYGLSPRQLQEDEFARRRSTRRNDLNVAVTQSHTRLVYPGPDGIAIRDLKVAGGEGGASVAEQIREILRKDGEVIEVDRASSTDIIRGLKGLFFSLGETPEVAEIRRSFAEQKKWPILESQSVLDRVISAGIDKSAWCLFRFVDRASDIPEHVHDAQNPVPMHADLSEEGWSIILLENARKRGWIKGEKPSDEKIQNWVSDVVRLAPEISVTDVIEKVRERSEAIDDGDVLNALPKVISQERLIVHNGPIAATDRPTEVREGLEAAMYAPKPGETLIIRSEAAKRGWLDQGDRSVLVEEEGAGGPLAARLKRLGRIFGGGKSTINDLRVEDLQLPGGASLEIRLIDATPESMKALDEFFEVMAVVGNIGEGTRMSVEIDDPVDDCPAVEDLKKGGT